MQHFLRAARGSRFDRGLERPKVSGMSQALPRPESGVGRWIKDPFCGLSHGFGAVVSIVGLVVLILASNGSVSTIVAVSIYGASLILLFTASFLAHSIHCSARTDNLLERLDYAAIFFLIAGSYTPICLTVLAGGWGWSILSIEWTLALIGATMVLWRGPQRWWVLLYVPMGWMIVVAIWPILNGMDFVNLLLLAIGGVVYTLGAGVFIAKRPTLWPGWFGSHDLWHVMVLLGSALHFVVVLRITSAAW